MGIALERSVGNGIVEEFFKFMTTENAKISYEKSLDIAIKYNDTQNIIDLEYRIKLLDKIKL